MMTAQSAVARTCAPVPRRMRTAAPTLRDVAVTSLRGAGAQEDSPECEFLVRYAELKSREAEDLQCWLESLEHEQLLHVRDVFNTAASDCAGHVNELSAQPFRASADQLKLVPQFWSDGSPFVHFRKPRLNTMDAIDDALGGLFVPVLRRR